MKKRKKQLESPAIKMMRTLTQKEASWLVGLTDRQLRNCPECPRLPDGRYNAQQVVAWHLERQTEDPIFSTSGETTPALERWRLARAVDAEVAALRKLGEVESTAILWQQVTEILTLCRSFATKMIRDYGNDVEEQWEVVVTQSQEIVDKYSPSITKKRTLRVELEDGTILTLPLPVHNN